MDYSSLAVLSKCPHAPVPNLGQFASPVADMHSMPVSDNPLVSGATSPLEHPSAVASPSFQLPAAVPLGGSGIDFIPSIAALPQMPYPVTAAAAAVPTQVSLSPSHTPPIAAKLSSLPPSLLRSRKTFIYIRPRISASYAQLTGSRFVVLDEMFLLNEVSSPSIRQARARELAGRPALRPAATGSHNPLLTYHPGPINKRRTRSL